MIEMMPKESSKHDESGRSAYSTSPCVPAYPSLTFEYGGRYGLTHAMNLAEVVTEPVSSDEDLHAHTGRVEALRE